MDIGHDHDRQDVFIPCHGSKLAAWVYLSKTATTSKPGPAIVLGHGLGGVKEMGLQNYCKKFQQEGYTCVAFDYRGFGGSTGDDERQVVDPAMQQQDWDAAIAYTRKIHQVDPERIGIFGSSFGGANVIRTAARDRRVKAAIAQCPFTSGYHSVAAVGFWVALQLTLLALRDLFFGRKNARVHVKLAGHPGEVAMMSSSETYDGCMRLIPKEWQDTFPNYVAASAGLAFPLYYPGREAKNVQCPIFFAICGKDSVAPPEPSLRYAAQAPKGVVKCYEEMNHFSIYVGKEYEIAVADYVSFLRQNLPVSDK